MLAENPKGSFIKEGVVSRVGFFYVILQKRKAIGNAIRFRDKGI